ncbi:MAG: hypothetical protein Q9218_006226 [Villophora microphyllina]
MKIPNRYSHAFVLSHYESCGFITLPRQPRSTPSPTASLLSFDPDVSYDADNTTTPPLSAVPALSESSTISTNSTASGLEDIPPRNLYSASSSIVTEIYSPQSPIQSPVIESTTPGTTTPEAPKPIEDIRPSTPLAKEEPLLQSLYSQPSSRFSSAHNFSVFFNPLPRPAKPKSNHGQRHKQHGRHPRKSVDSLHDTTAPKRTAFQPHSIHNITTSRPHQDHNIPYQRLQPAFSIGSLPSLPSLSLEDEHPDERVLSSDIDVLPWEYPDEGTPYVYRPRGFPSHQDSSPVAEIDNEFKTLDPTSSSAKARKSETLVLDLTNSPSIPSEYASSPLHNFTDRQPIASINKSTPPSFLPPTAPSTSTVRPLSRSSSTSSFDSAAPPPIRFHPYHHRPDHTSHHHSSPHPQQQPKSSHTTAKGVHPHSHAFSEWLNRAGGGRKEEGRFGHTGEGDWVKVGKRR